MDLEKNGFKTSEFWVAIATVTAGSLVLLGKIDSYSYPVATDIISRTLESICLIITQAVIIYKYMSMRHHLKSEHMEIKKNNSIEQTAGSIDKKNENLDNIVEINNSQSQEPK